MKTVFTFIIEERDEDGNHMVMPWIAAYERLEDAEKRIEGYKDLFMEEHQEKDILITRDKAGSFHAEVEDTLISIKAYVVPMWSVKSEKELSDGYNYE